MSVHYHKDENIIINRGDIIADVEGDENNTKQSNKDEDRPGSDLDTTCASGPHNKHEAVSRRRIRSPTKRRGQVLISLVSLLQLLLALSSVPRPTDCRMSKVLLSSSSSSSSCALTRLPWPSVSSSSSKAMSTTSLGIRRSLSFVENGGNFKNDMRSVLAGRHAFVARSPSLVRSALKYGGRRSMSSTLASSSAATTNTMEGDGGDRGDGGGGGSNNNNKQATYWNRETSERRNFSTSSPVVKKARILSLSDINDGANDPLNKGTLPEGAEIVQIGSTITDFDVQALKSRADGGDDPVNVIFVSHPLAREPLAQLVQQIPSIEWIHCRSAGIDFVTSPALEKYSHGVVTNAKGQFSSTLAEYTLMACSYFAKDLPRLLRNKGEKRWEKYNVEELRGKTLGIIGYGDIGRAAAKLAAIYGMRIMASRKHPKPDPLVDVVLGQGADSMNRVFAEADYVLCSAPLTSETYKMIGGEQFDCADPGTVFINVGRGPIVDEEALIEALEAGKLKGAALDVFDTEPLPASSKLWTLDNVLLSPHNMDQTATFMHEATEFFVQENLPRFLRGEQVLNPVDPVAGY